MSNRGFVVRVVVSVIVAASVAVAGRPLVISDAGAVDKGVFQLEAGGNYFADSSDTSGDGSLTLSYGLVSNLEVGIGIGCQWFHEHGDDTDECLTDLGLGAKWMFASQDRCLLDHALAVAVVIPTADEDKGLGSGEVDLAITWIGTRQITEPWAANVNVGYTWTGDPDDEDRSDLLLYGVSTTYAITEKLEPVLEVFAETPTNADGEWKTSVFINGGLRWLVSDVLTLDTAVGTTLSGAGPNVFATVGLTWLI